MLAFSTDRSRSIPRSRLLKPRQSFVEGLSEPPPFADFDAEAIDDRLERLVRVLHDQLSMRQKDALEWPGVDFIELTTGCLGIESDMRNSGEGRARP